MPYAARGLALALAAALAAGGAAAQADDISAGRAKARACTVCHGPLGVSVAPDTPHLAVQSQFLKTTELLILS